MIDGSREQTQAALASVSSTRLREYATSMFDVREVRIYGQTAEIVVALPNQSNGSDFYAVRVNVDLDGFWRIEGL